MTFLRRTVTLLTYQWDLPKDVSQLQLYAPCYVKRSNLWLFTRTDWAGRDSPWEVRRRAQAGGGVRLSSEPYGKHDARRDHVAAEPRPGGNARNARRGPGAPARVPAARALPSTLSLSLPGGAAPQSPASFSRTPRAGNSSSSRQAGRGDRARPFEPPRAPNPRIPQSRVSPPAPTARGQGTLGNACSALSTQTLSPHLEPCPRPHPRSKSWEPWNV